MKIFIVWVLVAESLLASTLSVRDANVTVTINSEPKMLQKDTNLSLNEGDAVCFKGGEGRVVIDRFKLKSDVNNSCVTLAVSDEFNITKWFSSQKYYVSILFLDSKELVREASSEKGPQKGITKQQAYSIPTDKKEMIVYSESFGPLPVTLNIKNTKGEVVQSFINKDSVKSMFRVEVESVDLNYTLVVTNAMGDMLLDVRFIEGNKIISTQAILQLDTKGHIGMISDIIVTKSKDIITSSTDKTIRVWDSSTSKEKRKILGQIEEGNKGMIYAMALSPNEEFFAVGGYLAGIRESGERYAIRIYNYHSGELIRVLKSHTNVVLDLSFSKDGKYLISASQDNTAKIWSVENHFSLKDTITAHSDYIYAVKIIKKDGEYLALTAGLDNKISLYSIDRRKILKKKKFDYKLMFVAITSKEIAICGISKKVVIMDYSFSIKKTIYSKTEPEGLAYSPNGKYLIVGTNRHPLNVNIYNTKDWSLVSSFKKHENLVRAVGFLDNQTAISAGGNNNEIYLWDIKNGSVDKKIEGAGEIVWSVGVIGDTIAWGNAQLTNQRVKDYTGKLQKIINLKTFQISKKLKMNNEKFNRISTINGNYSLIHIKGGNYRYSDGVLLIKEGSQEVARIVLDSSNGFGHRCYGWYRDYIISGGANGALKIYNKRGREVASLNGHTGEVWSIALDGDRLVSGSDDQTIRIWDLSKLKIKSEKRKINYEYLKREKEEAEKQTGKKWSIQDVMNFFDKQGKNYYIIPQIQPQLSLFISKNNEYIAWTPEGYFNASQKGMNYLFFHLNQGSDKEAKAIPMQKLYDHFYRPDLVKLKLAGEEEAYQKAIGKLDFHEALRNPPPMVKIDDMSTKTEKENIQLSFNLKDEGGGVGIVRIYQEGKLIQTIGEGEIKRTSANVDAIVAQEKLDKKAQKSQKNYLALDKSVKSELPVTQQVAKVKTSTITNRAGDYTIEVELKSGSNEISIEAFNKTNTVASFRDTVTINADIPKHKPKLYAIIAGVNEFESKNVNNLKYSENDAQAIKAIAQKEQGKIFDDVNITYLIGKDVTRANILKSAQEIAKKAKLEDTVLFYISTHGRSAKGKLYLVPQNNKKFTNWIDFEQTFKAVQSIKALNQIFVIDACESGKANDIVSAVYDSRASVLAKSSGVHMLLATTKGTSAFESSDPNVKNGVFTHRIIEALKSKETDKNSDNFVSVIELSKKLREPQSNAEYQYPVIRNVGKDVRMSEVGN